MFLRYLLFFNLLCFMNARSIETSNALSAVDELGAIPLPFDQKSTNSLVCLNTDFTFEILKADCQLLRNYIRYIHKIIVDPVLGDASGNCEVVDRISIEISKSCNESTARKLYPSSSMNEAYSLSVSKSGISLTAAEVWGAMRGLETLAQLVFRLHTGQISLFTTNINDKPRFQHRGLMLDTSRHYLHKSKLIETLKLMAMTKLNVFHWHIVDDQSFPYSSTTFPDMADKGAYNRFTAIYTQEDVADVIEAARRLGIRVIPEFDSPGHTQSWGKGLSDLLTKCYTNGKPDGSFGPVDPSNESNFKSLTRLFSEILRVFPDKFIHLGGDEVSFNCWKSNPDITSFMKSRGITTYESLESYYVNRLLQLVQAATPTNKNLTSVVWQEVFDNRVQIPGNVLVHVWKGGWQQEMESVTKAGYTALLSSCWYLNYISYGTDYSKYYNCDPHDFNGTDAQKSLVYGGEACMWGEYVDDVNVISRTWPRASAVAEVLWAAAAKKNLGDFSGRIQGLQCRMRKRGFEAEPINGPSTCDHPLHVGV